MKDKLARLVPAIVGELREAEARRERKQLEEQVRQAQRLEAVGRLAGGVAPDFNNLLTVVGGRGQLLLDRLAPGDPARREATLILDAVRKAAALTRQRLAFSRGQLLQTRALDVNAVVAEIEPMLRRLIGERIAVDTVLEPTLGRVMADQGHLEQVIVNLVVNARDAMPDGGRLTIETTNVALDDAYCRSRVDARPGPHVVLSVTDTGIGMPGTGGRELVRRLRAQRPGMRVLYVSGYDSITDDGALDAAFLEKPFTSPVLAHKVREVLNAVAKGLR